MMDESAGSSSGQDRQVQIRLKTVNEAFAVPDSAVSVPDNVGPEKLNKLVKSLLSHLEDEVPDFDFLISDDLLRTSLAEFIQSRDDLSPEHTIEVLYVEQKAPPEPQDSVNHNDWVSGVDVNNGLILSSCYDNTVCLWDASNASKKLQIPGHVGPAKAVVFIHVDPVTKDATFASGSDDQTVVLYKYSGQSNSIEGMNVGKGHARSVDCLAVDPTKNYVASGSFDTQLKIWSAKLTDVDEEVSEDGSESKKAKSASKAPTRTPLVTLAGKLNSKLPKYVNSKAWSY